MSATHEDWLNAKKRRDNAAFSLSKAFVAGNLDIARSQGVKYSAADAEMERIEREIDGRDKR